MPQLEGLQVVPLGEDHKDVVHEFLLDHFATSEPITCSLGCSRDDVFDFFVDLRDMSLAELSLLVFDQQKLIAICLNSTKTTSQPDDPPVWRFDPKKDYAADIADGPYKSHNANRLSVFIETVEEDLHNLVPAGTKVFKVEVLCVSRDYQGRGIGRWLVEESMRRAPAAGCEYVASVATAVASQAIFHKMGFQQLRELPFSCFREGGDVVFQNLPDGGRSGKLVGRPLEAQPNGVVVGNHVDVPSPVGDDEEDLR